MLSPVSAAMEFLLVQILLLLLVSSRALSKSTIEPCNGSDTCDSLVAYLLRTDLKVSEVATRFQVDPLSILGANGFDPLTSDSQTQILLAGSFLKVPIKCQCVNGIRKSMSTVYTVQPIDTLRGIADSVFGGLVTWDQIEAANNISDGEVLNIGQSLVIPLPCFCFNGTDNGFPAVYMSYAVRSGDSLASIAMSYGTTVTDLVDVNSLGSFQIAAGDIIAIPLAACSSDNLNLPSNSDLLVANGSYAVTADHCVQCSCGPNDLNLYCAPSLLARSCPGMQCKDSNLLIGDVIEQQTSAGCNVTSCLYRGYLNGKIHSSLTNFLQPQCLGKHVPPVYTRPPSTLPAPTPNGLSIPKSPSPATSPSPGTIGVANSNPAMGPSPNSCTSYKPLRSVSLLSMLVSGLPYLIYFCNR